MKNLINIITVIGLFALIATGCKDCPEEIVGGGKLKVVEYSDSLKCGSSVSSFFPASYDDWTSLKSWSAMIYDKSIVQQGGQISGLSFFADDCFNSKSYTVNRQKIFLATTNETAFTNSLRPDHDDNYTMKQVFEGDITWTEGDWNYIEFDENYTYDNSENLLVYFSNRHGGSVGSSPLDGVSFIWKFNGEGKSKYARSLNDNFPGDDGSIDKVLPIIRFHFNN